MVELKAALERKRQVCAVLLCVSRVEMWSLTLFCVFCVCVLLACWQEFAQSPPSGIRAGDDVQGRFQGALSSSPSHSLCATSGSPCTVWSSVQVSATRRNVWL